LMMDRFFGAVQVISRKKINENASGEIN
jgi:hypothetical protein